MGDQGVGGSFGEAGKLAVTRLPTDPGNKEVPNTQIRLDLSWRPVALSFFHIFVIFPTSEKYFQNIQRIFSKYFQPLQNIHIYVMNDLFRVINIRVLIMSIKIFQIRL